MEEVQEASFEDYSLTNTLEKLAHVVEQAVHQWLTAYAAGGELAGAVKALDSSYITAVEGARLSLAQCHNAFQSRPQASIDHCDCCFRMQWSSRLCLSARSHTFSASACHQGQSRQHLLALTTRLSRQRRRKDKHRPSSTTNTPMEMMLCACLPSGHTNASRSTQTTLTGC